MNKRTILIAVILATAFKASAQNIAPNTSLMLHQWEAQKKEAAQKNGMNAPADRMVSAFISVDDSKVVDELRKHGVTVRSVLGDVVTASLPLSCINTIAAIDGVKNIQAGSEVRLLMDAARADANVDACHTATESLGDYTGKGVVVGIVDNGFEYAHADFLKNDYTETRVVRVWEQGATSGNAPEKYGYGAEYTTLKDMKRARLDTYDTFHGTHVAGIAAGSDRSTNYYGVATEADIVLVSFITSQSTSVIDGIKYVFDYAESVGKPCVVNISLGTHLGPHDGTSDTDRALAELVGPGRIIVGAAGNEGTKAVHASKTFSEGNTTMKTMIGFDNDKATTKTARIDIWGDKDATLKVKPVVVNTKDGSIVAETSEVATDGEKNAELSFPEGCGVEGTVQMALQVSPSNDRPNVLAICSATSIDDNRRIGLVITGSEGSTVHMWNSDVTGHFLSEGKEGWTDGDDIYTIAEIGGISPDVITVGSYNTKDSYKDLMGNVHDVDADKMGNVGERSLFSSCGPTTDGRQKPDVVAPGCAVVSATSKYWQGFYPMAAVAKSLYANDCYDVNIGTSMSSPFVTGTVALWLQANPKLTPSDVRNILNASSRHDQYTGNADSCDRNKWGAGKIDAYAGLQIAAGKTGISDMQADVQQMSITTDRTARTAKVMYAAKGNATLSIYTTTGQKLAAKTLTASGQTVSLSQLTPGVYVFRLEQGGATHTVKATL
ncbi:S8 family peptidase [Prevotella sp.]|uniref:S8 family peptidase n=1 Tax=Prevotella sp. TaxID=59823 RepID=UPI003AF61FFA